MMKKLLTLSLVSLLCWSCNNSGTSNSTETNTGIADTTTDEYIPIDATSDAADMHNAQNSLDVVGVYKGVLPCADCEGIETEVELKDDDTYVKKTKYLGKGDGDVQEEKGSFSWEDGSNIVLNGASDGPNKYFVGENTLTTLDLDGEKVTGELAENYVLKK
ncbi:copper resistance protein NlpE N-terminal domain-containing protein [Olivibacter sp. SDN3]|uniref:copper resistance protein NlpE n=1 Tax=Olivibacter sp. SDN3 TaxID=2764720 RepID=UPI001651278E|nr:copper resistance protein NlpE [Olivibacter sp. SDN3]QNL52328.1 copper resistance protein NlpE N-terminal domain-containing protein [Olivibacter sp. SDN3]